MRKKTIPVITIDGPSAAGKGELAKKLAKHFNFNLLDSGAIYRILAYQLNELRISAPNLNEVFIQGVKKLVSLDKLLSSKKLTAAGEKLKRSCMIAAGLNIEFKISSSTPLKTLIYLDNHEISNKIRTEEVGKLASNWAVFPAIRGALLQKQRDFALNHNTKGLIADGRDMGSFVFKEAKIKLFITASIKIRALRRAKELRIEDDNHKIERLFVSIKQRDEQDEKRAVSPLIKVKNAIEIDTSDLTIDETFEQTLKIIQSEL